MTAYLDKACCNVSIEELREKSDIFVLSTNPLLKGGWVQIFNEKINCIWMRRRIYRMRNYNVSGSSQIPEKTIQDSWTMVAPLTQIWFIYSTWHCCCNLAVEETTKKQNAFKWLCNSIRRFLAAGIYWNFETQKCGLWTCYGVLSHEQLVMFWEVQSSPVITQWWCTGRDHIISEPWYSVPWDIRNFHNGMSFPRTVFRYLNFQGADPRWKSLWHIALSHKITDCWVTVLYFIKLGRNIRLQLTVL